MEVPPHTVRLIERVPLRLHAEEGTGISAGYLAEERHYAVWDC